MREKICENGIKAFSDSYYDYYELIKPLGVLPTGTIFVHDPHDHDQGSLMCGCLKLCWTERGNSYAGLCANTVYLHMKFAEDKTLFKKHTMKKEYKKSKIKKSIDKLEKELKELRGLI